MNQYSKFFKSETTPYWIIWKKLTTSLFSLQKYYKYGKKEILKKKNIEDLMLTPNWISQVLKVSKNTSFYWVIAVAVNFRWVWLQILHRSELRNVPSDFGKPSQLLISQLFVELKFVNSTFANSTFNYRFYIQNS